MAACACALSIRAILSPAAKLWRASLRSSIAWMRRVRPIAVVPAWALLLPREIIAAHGGTVACESTPEHDIHHRAVCRIASVPLQTLDNVLTCV